MLDHPGREDNLQPLPWEKEDIEPPDEYVNDASFRDIYDLHRSIILAPHNEGNLKCNYNFPIDNDFDAAELKRQLLFIYSHLNRAFKINLAFGLILVNIQSGEYRYFKAYYNVNILPTPVLISRYSQVTKLLSRLRAMDLNDYVMRVRGDTKWKCVMLTNVYYTVYKTRFLLGYLDELPPPHISASKSIVCFFRNRSNGRIYTDNLCVFRCLAFHITKSRRISRLTRLLFRRWVSFTRNKTNPFPGIDLSDFPLFEKCFEINVNIFSLEPSGTTRSITTSLFRYSQTMNLNYYNGHLDYISKMTSYAKKYECRLCQKLFTSSCRCIRHERTCTLQTRYKYPGGFVSHRKSVFERLADWGIKVTNGEDHYEWFIVFDFEAVLIPCESRSELWTFEHTPVSVSLSSNVDGYEAEKFFVNEDLNSLLTDMIRYMEKVGASAYVLARQKWIHVFSHLHQLISSWSSNVDEVESSMPPSSDDTMMEQTNCENDTMETEQTANPDVDNASEKVKRYTLKQLVKLLNDFECYCRELPVLGFNSAKYDLNLIKSKIAKHLQLHQKQANGKNSFTVKKNNTYLCISNGDFKFLDIVHFLPPGTSYAKFLATFRVAEKKSFFPYEWFTSVDKLNETALPPPEAFYSSLKGSNTLESEEYIRFSKLLDSGMEEWECLAQMHLSVVPVSQLDANYEQLLTAWRDEGMINMRDFLEYYNNLDVGPFRQAVERFQLFFFDKSVDIFKVCISAPGAARHLLFRHAKMNAAAFALLDKRDEDLYRTIKANLIGGPSIVFHRWHKTDETLVRGISENICKSIIGFDANSLYLYAIAEFMPTGSYIVRKKDNGFRPIIRDRYEMAFHWLDWLQTSEGLSIQHKRNSVTEKRVGPYMVDGFDSANNTIFEYNGCFWHNHEKCQRPSEKWRKIQTRRREETRLKAEFLRGQGFELITMWECQFNKLIRENIDLKTFVLSRRHSFCRRYPGSVDVSTILASVENDLLFGFLEVDIEVPEYWGVDHPHNTELSPQEYFSEMCPLFCTTAIPFEAMGDHMQRHILKHNLSKKPRSLLVSGLKGKRMLIATPLLKWYLRHGLKVSEVHQVVEFAKDRCFKSFMNEVTAARRDGDRDASQAVLATLMKLLANSAYGSLIMSKERHSNITYVDSVKKAGEMVNDRRFRDLVELDDEFFEIEMAKKTITLDLPIQLGYFILQYAKLRLLQFYFDFVDVNLERTAFQAVTMDTDSLYIALNASTFREAIKPCMRSSYDHALLSFCNDDDEIEGNGETHWLGRTCCRRHNSFDLRTPGLFKVEFEGSEMIALCSKTYLITSSTRNETKYSSKGVNKTNIYPLRQFRSALFNRKTSYLINRGMRARNNTIFSYEQHKSAFSYFYCKREVLNDGVSTKPLDLVLEPIIRE